MATQEDFTAFAKQYEDIEVICCSKCTSPEEYIRHGVFCEDYKQIYTWIENRVREQCAKGLEEAKALFITNSEKVRVEWDEGFDYIQRAQFNYGFDVAKVIFDGSITLVKGEVK